MTSTPPTLRSSAEAGQLLIDQKPMVLAYGTDNIKDSMISGSCAIAVDYSGAAAAAIAENPDLDYVVPKEGSNVWVDCIVIMKNSEHKKEAQRFIDFLCRPGKRGCQRRIHRLYARQYGSGEPCQR